MQERINGADFIKNHINMQVNALIGPLVFIFIKEYFVCRATLQRSQKFCTTLFR